MLRSLTARTVLVLGLLAGFVAGMFALLMLGIVRQHNAVDSSRASQDRVQAAIAEQKLLVDVETGLRGYLITADRSFLQPYERARRALPAEQARLAGLARRDGRMTRVARLNAGIAAYVSDYAEPLAAAPPPAGRRGRSAVTADGKRRMDGLRARLDAYVRGEVAAGREASYAARSNFRRTLLLAVGGLGSSVLLVLVVAFYQLRFVLAPIRHVAAGARRIAMGDLSVRVPDTGGGEIADLGASFNLMATSLEYSRDELEHQNAELESQQAELEVAVDDLAAQKERIDRFQGFASKLMTQTEVEPLADAILDGLAAIVSADVGAVYAFVDGAGEAALVGTRGLDLEELPRNIRSGTSIAGRAIAERRPVTVSYDEEAFRTTTLAGRVAVSHEAHLPLLQGGRVVGVVTLGRIGGVRFAPADVLAIEHLADRAAIGLSAAVALRLARNQAVLNRAVLDTAADAFLSVDDRGVITGWNRASELMLGRPAEEALGTDVFETLVPERLRAEYARHIHDDEAGPGTRELILLAADGSELTVEATVSPLRVGDRRALNVFARDVTARKRQELYRDAHHAVTRGLAEALTLEDARTAVLGNLGPLLGADFAATLRVDTDSHRLRLSSAWSAAAGEGARLTADGDGLAAALADGAARRAMTTGEPVVIADLAAALPAGHLRESVLAAGLRTGVVYPVGDAGVSSGAGLLAWTAALEPDTDMLEMLGALGSQIGLFIARKSAEAEADRLKDEFFALVSHELRTPLTSIIGYLELVLEDDGVDEQSRRFLDVVHRNAGRLLRLVGDLLFVAQVEAGKLALEPAAVDLAEVCAESLATHRVKAEAAGVDLTLDAERLPVTQGDSGRLGQAVDNLVSNALKFTPAGGSVAIRLRGTGDSAVLEVSDTGIGIPAGEQTHLFERFFRSTTAHEQAVPGAGLGLTIVKAIIGGHGGSIDVRSQEGRGSTFTVELPLRNVATDEVLLQPNTEVHP